MSKNRLPHHPTNESIRGNEFRVIGPDGENLGVLSREEALKKAEEHELDLVLIAPKANPQVVKVIDYSKFRYEQQKAASKQRKANSSSVKELRFKPNIDTHDLDIRVKKAVEFLEDGDKVRVSIPFFGRIITHKEIGREKMDYIIEKVAAVGEPEKPPRMEGNFMVMILKPS